MDAAVLQAASVAWAAISALAVLLLGVVTLAAGRARPPGTLALGAFAVLWGAHVLAGRWMAYATPEAAPVAHLTYLAFLLPLPYLLLEFARAYAKDAAASRLWRAGSLACLLLALGAATALLAAPDLVYEGPTRFEGRVFPDWGPLYGPLAIAPFFAVLGVTLVALDRTRRASATPRASLHHALLAGGLGAFTAFSAGNNLVFSVADPLVLGTPPLADGYLPLFLALTAVTLAVGARAAAEALRAPSTKARRPALLVAAATLGPLAWGLVEGVLAYTVLPRFSTVGLWRLLGVALLAYALARSRMPDLAPRSRRTAATALGIAGAATTGGVATGVFLLVAPGTPLALLAALVTPLATLTPTVQLAQRALHVDPAQGAADATLARRVETYRAALEASLARGSLAEDEAFLRGLRERLAIAPDAHEALLCVARESVLPAPDATHPGYELLRLLGEGAHGRAWLARRRADDDLVVLKEPVERTEPAREALLRQARLAQRVRHARLVRLHHVAESARGPFLVMDHLPGGSLADRLAEGPLPPAEAVRATMDVLEGLDALHRAGLTHGDVKPSNVLLDLDGRACLGDFGLMRAEDPEVTRTALGAQGSLAAMAPEQLDGAPATRGTDVYAAGALLYRLLTGEHYVAFAGLDETRARGLVRESPPRLPHPLVPPGLEPVLRRALAKHAGERYASAAAMRADLERLA